MRTIDKDLLNLVERYYHLKEVVKHLKELTNLDNQTLKEIAHSKNNKFTVGGYKVEVRDQLREKFDFKQAKLKIDRKLLAPFISKPSTLYLYVKKI